MRLAARVGSFAIGVALQLGAVQYAIENAVLGEL